MSASSSGSERRVLDKDNMARNSRLLFKLAGVAFIFMVFVLLAWSIRNLVGKESNNQERLQKTHELDPNGTIFYVPLA